MTEEERKKKKRENSFIRDGYEIYIEGTYIVNGKRKQKIKKRKLSRQQIERHNKQIEKRVQDEKAQGNLAEAQRIEQELQALSHIGKQTQLMAQAQQSNSMNNSRVVTLKPS